MKTKDGVPKDANESSNDFNRNKKTGMQQVHVGDKLLYEAVV